MSGICSKHQGHDKECRLCNALKERTSEDTLFMNEVKNNLNNEDWCDGFKYALTLFDRTKLTEAEKMKIEDVRWSMPMTEEEFDINIKEICK